MADGHPEIIIVRRVVDEEHEHHGGVWKIALADFMTTLMALFLVLWLIKASNEETKTSIANYFNPISLSEALPSRKGVNDPKAASADPVAGNTAADPVRNQAPNTTETDQRDRTKPLPPGSVARERELFQDPYAVLATLAAEPDSDRPQSATVGDLGEPGRRGGDATRDPFDPLYWQVTTLAPARADRPASEGITPPPKQAQPDARADRAAGVADDAAKVAGPRASDAGTEGKGADSKGADSKTGDSKAGGAKAGDAQVADAKPAEGKEAEAASAPGAGQGPDSAAQTALKAEIAKIFPPNAAGPHVDVKGISEGLLINVTDDLNFSMFALGSAEPRPEMVRAMARIAKALATRPGRIIIIGHTDSRPFHSEVYDNWRLSTARAQMAAYMLIRAGISEKRIWRIEGAADRTPRNAEDPKAPENRRIEILLQGAPE